MTKTQKSPSYTEWRKEWSDQATVNFEVMRADFVQQHGGEMFRARSYEHALFGDPRLTFTHHSAFLENYFPGSSVTWDANPDLRDWANYSLTIVTMEPGEWMWARYKHQYEIPDGVGRSTYRMRRLAKNGDFRDVVRAGVDNGFHELVAHHLVPNPAAKKRQPWIEHKIAVEVDERHRTFSGMYPAGVVRKVSVVRSVYALYNVKAERWCVVR